MKSYNAIQIIQSRTRVLQSEKSIFIAAPVSEAWMYAIVTRCLQDAPSQWGNAGAFTRIVIAHLMGSTETGSQWGSAEDQLSELHTNDDTISVTVDRPKTTNDIVVVDIPSEHVGHWLVNYRKYAKDWRAFDSMASRRRR